VPPGVTITTCSEGVIVRAGGCGTRVRRERIHVWARSSAQSSG
jgi:hypothetical protein